MKVLNGSLLALILAGGADAQNFGVPPGDIKFGSIDGYDAITLYPNVPGTTASTIAQANTIASAPAPGSYGSGYDTMLIFSVGTISPISGPGGSVFTPGVDGYLTGIITGLTDYTVVVSAGAFGGPTRTQTVSTGGLLSIWHHTTPWNPSLSPVGAGVDLPNNIYPGISNGGTLYLQGQFVPGVLAGNTQATFYTDYTYLNGAPNGAGQGFLNLTGGSALSTFDTNALADRNGVLRDMYFTRTYDDVNGAAGGIGWTVKSIGQLSGFAIPEPSSMLLVGLGLGVLVARRRRND